jgi:hypothetical protein
LGFGDLFLGTRPHRWSAFVDHDFYAFADARPPHQKILQDKIAFAAHESSAATTALYFAINRFRSGFDLNHAVERVATRAMK